MKATLRSLPALAAVVLLGGLAVPAPALAQTTVTARHLGMSKQISFPGRAAEVVFPVPVPAGLRPKELTGSVQTPVDLATGNLEAWSDDLLLARIPFDGRESVVPVRIPLERATVRGGVANVTLRTVLTSRGEACPDWSDRSLELLDATIEYDGRPEPPKILADFMPPVLDRLEIYLPEQPSQVESEAAAELVTAASAEFGSRGL